MKIYDSEYDTFINVDIEECINNNNVIDGIEKTANNVIKIFPDYEFDVHISDFGDGYFIALERHNSNYYLGFITNSVGELRDISQEYVNSYESLQTMYLSIERISMSLENLTKLIHIK